MTTTIKFNPNYIDLVSEILMDVCPGIFIVQIQITLMKHKSKLKNIKMYLNKTKQNPNKDIAFHS